MSAADIDAPEHAGKCVVRITSRPSTLEEDEWALGWLRLRFGEHAMNGCLLSCSYIFIVGALFTAVSGFVISSGWVYAWIAGAVLLGFSISYLVYRIRTLRPPTVQSRVPLGQIVTVSVPVKRAWKSPPVKNYGDVKCPVWIFELAPHLHVMTRLGLDQKAIPIGSDDFHPSERIEIDYYTEPHMSLHPANFRGSILALRSACPMPFEHCDEKLLMQLPTRYYGLDEGFEVESDVFSDPVVSYILGTGTIAALIWDLRHPFYADTCHVIDDRPA